MNVSHEGKGLWTVIISRGVRYLIAFAIPLVIVTVGYDLVRADNYGASWYQFVGQGDFKCLNHDIPGGHNRIGFLLHIPAMQFDVDAYLYYPSGSLAGSSIKGTGYLEEEVYKNSPVAGSWNACDHGYFIPGGGSGPLVQNWISVRG